jgi:GLPGLI family protein
MGNKYLPKKTSFCYWSILFLLYVLIATPSCKSILSKDTNGTIEYEISYPDSMKSDIMSSMLPSKMEFKFVPDYTLSQLKVGMGIITATFIADSKNKTLTSLFKVVDKKYALKYSIEETAKELSQLPKFSIEYLPEKKMLAGYTCKKAVITQIGNPKNSFSVFYTTDIKIINPNWNLPYATIPGVLMEYQIQHKDILMTLKAKKVILEALDEEQFAIPADYKVVKKDELPEIIQSFF